MKEPIGFLNRRALIGAAGLGALALGLPRGMTAAEWTDLETANVKVVNDFLHARWIADPLDFDKLASFLADDCVRGARTTNLTRGREAIIESIRRSSSRVLKRNLRIIETLAIGPIVINERVESQTMAGRDGAPSRDAGGHVVGVFEVRDGKIKEWRAFGIEDKERPLK